MKVDVSKLLAGKEKSIKLEADFDQPLEDLSLCAPVHMNLELTNVRSGILVAGNVDTKVNLVCSRCAADYVEPLNVRVDELFINEDSSKSAKDSEVEASDLCVFTCSDNIIEIDEVLRQNLLASLPFLPLCKEDCRGLCSRCGADLNIETCSCAGEEEKTDPRWKVLEQFCADSSAKE